MMPAGVRGWMVAWMALAINGGDLCARQPAPRFRVAIPAAEGPLRIKVVYPNQNDRVDVLDSSFVFGSVGDGRATLTINGQSARVYPNGAFIGWIRYPAESPARLELVARHGAESQTVTLSVKRVERFRPPA